MVSYAIQDPFEGLIKGQDYVNGLFDQHARLQAGQAYAAGDLTGAAKLLASRGMIPDAQAINTEGTTRSALTAYDAGDPAGALTAAAKGGNADLYGKLDTAQTKEKADRAEWMGNAADALLQIKDPQAREAAFQGQIVPVLKSMGVDQAHIDQIEAGHLTDENLMAFKTSLGQLSAMDVQTTPEGDVLGIDKKTGQVRVLHHSTPKPTIVPKGSTVISPDDPNATPAATPGPSDAVATPANAPVQASPKDVDALARMILSEAGGEGATGMAAAGQVAVNRLKTGYGGAKTLADVVAAPHQFEGMTTDRANVPTSDPGYQKAYQVALAVVHGQIPDPTNGATNFLNPELQAADGRQQPAWANGRGLRIGNHVFYGGGNPGGNAGDQPYQVASAGATPPPPSSSIAPKGYHVVYQAPDEPTGHPSTPAELKAAGLPDGTAAWTDEKGKPVPYAEEFQPPPTSGPNSNLTGDEFLKTLPTGYASQLKAYANGDLAMPTGNRAGGRDQQKLLNDIMQYDPTASAANLPSRLATRKNFTSGPYSQTLNATNTVIGHLGNLETAIDRLDNTGLSWINGPAQWIGQNVGDAKTQKAVADFNTYRTMVANELTKVYRGSGGAEADIQGWQKQLDSASSPAALHATVKAMVTGLDSRLEALGQTYSQGMGKTTDPLQLLTPHARSTFERLQGDVADTPHVAANTPAVQGGFPAPMRATLAKFKGATAKAGTAGNPFAPISKKQYDGLPSGSHYIFTDGRIMVKP